MTWKYRSLTYAVVDMEAGGQSVVEMENLNHPLKNVKSHEGAGAGYIFHILELASFA